MSVDVFPMYLHCIRSLRFFESCWFFSHTNRHLLSTSVTCHGMVFLCFCIVYVRYTFWKMYLIFFDSVQLYILVYVRYMSWDVFPMYLHCIRLLHFFWEMLFFSHTNRHLLCTIVTCHGMVFLCFALYTFVTLFERCIWFIFFFIQFSCINCLRSLHVIRCFSYVFALYTFVTFFWELLVFFSHKQASLVYIRYMSCEGFSYVFALYTFVTLFERCIWFFF